MRLTQTASLTRVRILHTAIWLFFAGCIVAIPFATALRRFRTAALLSGVVLVECMVLACNGGRCPLTDVAARYTDDRRASFDIYLPEWLARRNKTLFGTLFLLSDLFLLIRWLRS